MFERFTDEARTAIVLSQESARMRGSAVIDTSDLLNALIRLPDSDVGGLLRRAGLDPDSIHGQTGDEERQEGHLPFQLDSKQALAEALRASLSAGHGSIAPAHLLLGVLALPEGTAREALLRCGVDPERLTADTRQALVAKPPPHALPDLSFRDWTPPAGAVPAPGSAARSILALLIGYATLVALAAWRASGLYGPIAVLVVGAVLPPLLLVLSRVRTPRVYRLKLRQVRKAAASTVPLPEELLPVLAARGVTDVAVFREHPKVHSRCRRNREHAYVVLAQEHLRQRRSLQFVLPHELAHLLRNDSLSNRVAWILVICLVELVLWSASVTGAVILPAGALLLWVAKRWSAELACDVVAARWTGVEGAAAFVEESRARSRSGVNRKPGRRLRRAATGWLLHPPLALRLAFVRVRVRRGPDTDHGSGPA